MESIRDALHKLLGNKKDVDYKKVVRRMLTAFKDQECNMSLKAHFLYSHVNYFPESLATYNEKQGEQFHEDLIIIEKYYDERLHVNMMGDYC